MNMNFCCCLAIETVCLFGIMFLLSHSNKQWKYSCKFRAYMFSSWIFLAASSLLQSNSLHIEWKMPPTLFSLYWLWTHMHEKRFDIFITKADQLFGLHKMCWCVYAISSAMFCFEWRAKDRKNES